MNKFDLSIKGPVFPVITPFTFDEKVNYKELENYIYFLTSHGAKNILVTIGTSRFNLLTVEEMLNVNACVVQSAAGHANVIVTTPPQASTDMAVRFVQHAQDCRADGILAVYPERYYNDAAIIAYFKKLCEVSKIPILIHLSSFVVGCTRYSSPMTYTLQLIKKLLTLPNIIGIKEESQSPLMNYEYNRHFNEDMIIIGGTGGMRAQLVAHLWGQPAWLTSIGSFIPEIELYFYAKLSAGDIESATRLMFLYEEPFFRVAVEIGWHPALKAALALKGLMSTWERSPLLPPVQEDIARIKSVLEILPYEKDMYKK